MPVIPVTWEVEAGDWAKLERSYSKNKIKTKGLGA
jgi:hypothetical protein